MNTASRIIAGFLLTEFVFICSIDVAAQRVTI